MNQMSEKYQEPKIPDFVLGIKNSVFAAYATGPEILELDDHDLLGVPFIFYPWSEIIKTEAHDVELERKKAERRLQVDELKRQGVPYLNILHFRDIFDGAVRLHTNLKETVCAGAVEIPLEELVKFEKNLEYHAVQVPYSFDGFHESDIRKITKVRGIDDYRRMIKEILPVVRKKRNEEAKREFYKSRLNRLLNAFHWDAPPEPPITYFLIYTI